MAYPTRANGFALSMADYAERLVLGGLFTLAALANFGSQDPLNLLLMVGHVFSVGFVVFRRRTFDVSHRPLDWGIVFVGTVLSLMLRPSDTAIGWESISSALLMIGAGVTVAAKLSLNTRFGVVPANRGVQTGGAYAVVRHPMYLGYALAELGYLLQNFSFTNLALLAVIWPLQLSRIGREECWLQRDPLYRGYQSRTKYRLLPWFY